LFGLLVSANTVTPKNLLIQMFLKLTITTTINKYSKTSR